MNLSSPTQTPIVLSTAPAGFIAYTRGAFTSEARAVASAKKRGPQALVVYSPKSRWYEESWHVGFIITPRI